jgi:GT2 family glycosyltransferase
MGKKISRMTISTNLLTGAVLKQGGGKSRLKISVIIVNWNRSELTVRCIDSVKSSLSDIACEIIVVDNGSQKPELELLKSRAPHSTKIISLLENLFFGEANNIGAESSDAEYLLFLNNDVCITEDTMALMLKVFESEPCVGAVGPKFLFPDGRMQEAGAFVWSDGWTFQQGKFECEFEDKFKVGNHPVDYCSAACLLMRRDVFLGVDGFDPLFDPAYFEDADLALRLKSIGLYTYFCADTKVYHDEHGTSSEIWSSARLSEVTIQNHARFFNRWQAYLEERLELELVEPHLGPSDAGPKGRDQRWPRGRLLLCASTMMAISDECENLLRIAASLGEKFDIILAASERCSRARVYSLCRNMGLRLSNFQIVRFSTDIVDDYDAVIFGHGWEDNQDALLPGQFVPARQVLCRLLDLI